MLGSGPRVDISYFTPGVYPSSKIWILWGVGPPPQNFQTISKVIRKSWFLAPGKAPYVFPMSVRSFWSRETLGGCLPSFVLMIFKGVQFPWEGGPTQIWGGTPPHVSPPPISGKVRGVPPPHVTPPVREAIFFVSSRFMHFRQKQIPRFLGRAILFQHCTTATVYGLDGKPAGPPAMLPAGPT